MDWLPRRCCVNIACMNLQAKFLVLLDDAPRALLFDSQRRLLGEVIEEDGFIVDSLLRSASECSRPDDAMLGAVVPPPFPQQPVRCFELQ